MSGSHAADHAAPDAPGAAPDDLAGLVDARGLAAFLRSQPGYEDTRSEPVVERIPGGQSNLTFTVDLGGRRVVLRRPPPGPLPPSAHDVLREYRVLAALASSAVPVPRPLLACPDPSVVGAPFYLMELVPGVIVRFGLPPAFEAAPPEARRGFGDRLVDTLAALHRADPAAIGLADLGRPAGYLPRQLKRWQGQLEYARTRPTVDLDWVADWLLARVPADDQPAALVHGDFGLHNALFAPEPPARLLAVIDWEMSTLGDPLTDLGYLLALWRDPGDEPPELPVLSRLTELPGFPRRTELEARYEEQVRRPLPDLRFYVVLALWKLAIIFEGHWARQVRGTAAAFDYAYLERGNPAFAARIRRTAASGSWAPRT